VLLRLEERLRGQGMGLRWPVRCEAPHRPLCCLIRERPVNADGHPFHLKMVTTPREVVDFHLGIGRLPQIAKPDLIRKGPIAISCLL